MRARANLAEMNRARRLDLRDQSFGRLKAVEPAGQDKWGALLWRCICDCGNEAFVKTSHLRRSSVESCGCLQLERRHSWNRSHGGAHTRLYRIWQGMHTRTTNPKCQGWRYYGNRGITVCAEWQEFEPFRAWAIANKYASDLSIDRIDNDGNYEPSNCRWADQSTQVRNRRPKVAPIQQRTET